MSQQHPKTGEWYARVRPNTNIQEWAVYVNHENGTRSMTAIACAIPDSDDLAEIELASQRSEEVAVGISALPDLIEAARDVTDLMVTNGRAHDVTDPVLVGRLGVAVVKLQLALWKAGAGPET